MRTRTKINRSHIVQVAPFQQIWVGHSTYTVPGGTIHTVHSDVENMTDDPDSAIKGTKAVIHTREVIVNNQIDSEDTGGGGNLFLSNGNNCFWHVWGEPGGTMSPAFISKVYPKTEEELQRECQHAFYNSNEVNNLVNVTELDDLVPVGLYAPARRLCSTLLGAYKTRTPGRISPRELKKFFRDSSAVISGGFLYYSFGVAPLISDMRKMSRATSSFKRKLERHVKQSETVYTVHRSCKGEIGPLPNGSPSGYPTGWGSAQGPGVSYGTIIKSNNDDQPVLTCTVKGTKKVAFNSPVFQQLDYLTQQFGATGPATFAWEKIPYSFVVDWFVDMSAVLDRIDNALTGNTRKITDICLSQAWSAKVSIFKIPVSGVPSSNDGAEIGTREYRLYTRKPANEIGSISASGNFGKKQVALSAALFSQLAAKLTSKLVR